MEQLTRRLGAYAGYFISGAGIGAAIGVLFAPKVGRETRRDLSLWFKKAEEQGRVEYRAMTEALESGRKTFLAKQKVNSGG